ncbi:waprin-Phi1-like [Podarcis raffonei]|uniref:waprin-Phi1-like n=1 Tax=Podarcis raffonei TaxID=65483 RepID=UPI00232947DA|nr:waprin-Phi1-like [Podarcis raffonei]
MEAGVLWLLTGLLLLQGCAAAAAQSPDYGEERTGKDGFCPASPNGLYDPPCKVDCEADSECAGGKKCCEFACKHVCLPASQEKPGSCPPPLLKKLQAPLVCGSSCTDDASCPRAQKCCDSGCGSQVCRIPIEEKPGKCPLVQRKTPSGGGGEPCSDTCAHDWQCKGDQKCCFSGFSMECTNVPQAAKAGGGRPGSPTSSTS